MTKSLGWPSTFLTPIVAIALCCQAPATAQDRPLAEGLVPLYTCYSETRGDFFTTTDPTFEGKPGDRRTGQGNYRLVRLEG